MGINILLIGNCGVGKTHVMQTLIKSLHTKTEKKIGLLHYLQNDPYIITGRYMNDLFDGSDKLAMNVMSSLDEFLIATRGKIVLYEGDRFMNSSFIKKAQPYIIKILGDGKKGREKRNSQQTARHLKSIQTRVNNINPNLELINSNVCISVILFCILHATGIEDLKQHLLKQERIHKKQQHSLF